MRQQPPVPGTYEFYNYPIRLPLIGCMFSFRATATCEALSLGGVDYPAYELTVSQSHQFTRMYTAGDMSGGGGINYNPWVYDGYIWFDRPQQQSSAGDGLRHVLGVELEPLYTGDPPAMWFGVHSGFASALSVQDYSTFISLWRKEANTDWQMVAGQPADDPEPLGSLNGRFSLQTTGVDLIKPDGDIWQTESFGSTITKFPLTWQAATTPGKTIEFDYRIRSDSPSEWLLGETEQLVTRRYKFTDSGFTNRIDDSANLLHTPIRYYDSLFRIARFEMEIGEGESPYVSPDQKRYAPALFYYPIYGDNEDAADLLPTIASVVSAGGFQPDSPNPWTNISTVSIWCNATGSWNAHMAESYSSTNWASRVAIQTPIIQRGRSTIDTLSAKCGRVLPKHAVWESLPGTQLPLYFYVELVDYRIM